MVLALALVAGTPAAMGQAPSVDFNTAITSIVTQPASVDATTVAFGLGNPITLSRGSGLGLNTAGGRFNSNGLNAADLSAAISGSDFYTFSVTVNNNYALDASLIAVTLQSSSTGASTASLLTSATGFSATDVLTTNTGLANATRPLTLSSALLGSLTGTTEFRIYGYGATGATGTTSINALQILGPTSIRWTGGANANLTDGGNYMGGLTPVSTNGIQFEGSSNTTVNVDAPTTVGGLGFAAGAAAFTINNANTITLSAGGIANFSGVLQTINTDMVFSAGSQIMNASSGDILIAGNISGAGTVNNRVGTVTLSGTNSYTGGTTVTGGTLVLSGSYTGATTVAGGTMVLSGSNATSGAVAVNAGTLTVNGSAVLTLTGTNNLSVSSGGTTATANFSGSSVTTVGGNLLIANSGTSNTNGTVNVSDSAALTVSGNLAVNGIGNGTNIRNTALLSVSSGTVNVTGTLSVTNSGDNATGIGTITVSGGTVTANALSIIGTREKGAAVNVNVNGGILQATNGVNFGSANPSNTTTAVRLTVDGGTLKTSGITGAANTTNTTFSLRLLAGTIEALADNTNFISGFTSAQAIGTSGITINSGAFNIGIPQALSGATGSLTKTGAGVLALSGTNTYGGTTTVTAGTLLANRQTSGSSTGIGDISIESGATLGGNGRVGAFTPQLITVKSGGILTAGTDVANPVLLALGNVAFDAGSSFKATLFGTGTTDISLLNAVSNVTTPGNAALRLDLSALSPIDVQTLRTTVGVGNSRTYTVASAGGTSGNFGSIDVANSNFANFNSSEWSLTPNPASNTLQVDFTPVPEPGMLLGLATLAFGAARRIRRRK